MSKTHERTSAEIRGLRKLLDTLSHAQTAEQVFASCLNTIHDISEPTNAYVVLPEPGVKSMRGVPELTCQPGWVTDLTVPVILEGEVAGQFALHFDGPHAISDVDLNLIETIAALAGLCLNRIRERQHFNHTLQKKNEAVAMAVHELRAPLTAIFGAASLLRSDGQEQREQAAAIISRNARTQEQFIADLLNLAQLDSGKRPLRLAVMDVASIVEQVIEEIRPVAANASISITTRLDRPIMVRGDAQRLRQIFWNLLSNSVRFVSPNGRIDVLATVEKSLAKICVSDDGCGIPPDRIGEIFDRFEQVHDSPPRKYDGFGLGLAVVKEFVLMLDGTVTAQSEGPGKGAQFTVRLPCVP